ncbi:MAG: ParB/RepB/Spo0J family partition protein [Planctomycetaceae bacterium]|nr:ParB/RepB/Spo0J family partition protein [Planctomycetaceae bacterium]
MKVRQLDLSLLDPDPEHPRQRMDPDELERLKWSVVQFGILQPIIVFVAGTRFTIVEGHRRCEAASLAELREVPAIVLAERPDAHTLLLTQLHANSMRSDLRPTELATAYKRLQDLNNRSVTELAAAMHISKGTATQYLSLLSLSEEVLAMVDDGRLARSTAYAICRETDADKRQAMIRKAGARRLRRDDAAREVSRKVPSHVRSVFPLASGEVVLLTPAEPEIAECVTILQAVITECRRATRNGLSLQTLLHAMRDRRDG